MESIQKAFLLYTGCLKEMQFELLFEFKPIFSRTTILLERTTNQKLWFFRLGCLTNIFLKMNKVSMSSCHFKENNWQNLLPVIKFKPSNINQNLENFTRKLEFGKFVSGSVSFMAFQHLKLFPMRLVVILTKLIYLILYNEMCQYSEKMCITQ